MNGEIIDVSNFEAGEETRQINSPRTLESCLRQGIDPSELYPRDRGSFHQKGMSKDQLDLKYTNFERKRQEKIADIKREREAIIAYATRKSQSQPNSPNKVVIDEGKEAGAGLIEAELKRMEALRRRQEKELEKIMEREAALAEVHQKIQRAEIEEFKKKREHEKAVLKAKAELEKKNKARAAEKKRAEEDDLARKKEIERKEAAFAEKMKKLADIEAKRIEEEAREAERIRQEKMEEYRKKTEALIKQQADLAEKNRLIMVEREIRVKAQMVEKKEQKRLEVEAARAAATLRIQSAIERSNEMHEKMKADFHERQTKAEQLAKENAVVEREKQKKAAEDREKKNKIRYDRLVTAFNKREDYRQSIVDHRNARDGGYERIEAARQEEIQKQKYLASLKVQDKIENVERRARINEFKRLQTLKRIEDGDRKYEEIQGKKNELMDKYRATQKSSLTRKHAIADAMDMMRVTGDTKILDKIFAEQTSAVTEKDAKEEEETEAKPEK